MHGAIASYRISDLIYESATTLVYRAYHPLNGQKVILKLIKPDLTSPLQLARLKREYDLLRGLDFPGVIKA